MLRSTLRIVGGALAIALMVAALSGCGLLPAKDQTVNDEGGAFHLVLPGDWSTSSGPGVITVYGDKEMPDPNGAIGSTPWFFVMTAQGESKGKVAEELVKLAKQRAHSRGWKNTEFGKPVETKLGREKAWEMDISGSDEKGRAFEGKLALARAAGNEVLLFAFTEPGKFAADSYDTLKSQFYWHTPAEAADDSASK